MREKFYFFGSFRDTAQAIEDTHARLEYLEAVIRCGLELKEKEISPLVNALMVQTRFTLERSKSISSSASERWKKWWAPQWNKNAKKNWEVVIKQANSNKNNQTQAKTSEIEEEKEIEVEEKVKEETTATAPTTKNIEYINWMRSVELKGRQYLRAWNELIGDNSIMSTEVKKWIYNIQNSISAEEFKTRVEKFSVIKDLILKKKMQNYFYYPIWNRTLENFLEHINKFYWEDSVIISRIAKKDEIKKALRVLETTISPNSVNNQELKKEMTVEEKQKAKEVMLQARKKLLNHIN